MTIPAMRSSLACVVVTLPDDGEVLVPVDELVRSSGEEVTMPLYS
jgi:hypothetical protein